MKELLPSLIAVSSLLAGSGQSPEQKLQSLKQELQAIAPQFLQDVYDVNDANGSHNVALQSRANAKYFADAQRMAELNREINEASLSPFQQELPPRLMFQHDSTKLNTPEGEIVSPELTQEEKDANWKRIQDIRSGLVTSDPTPEWQGKN
jgi:hypothetical protein